MLATACDDGVWLTTDRQRLERPVARRQRDEGEVDLSAREGVEQCVDASRLVEVDLREVVAEAPADRRHEAAADPPEEAEAHARQRRVLLRAHLLLRRLELGEDRRRVGEEDTPLV